MACPGKFSRASPPSDSTSCIAKTAVSATDAQAHALAREHLTDGLVGAAEQGLELHAGDAAVVARQGFAKEDDVMDGFQGAFPMACRAGFYGPTGCRAMTGR